MNWGYFLQAKSCTTVLEILILEVFFRILLQSLLFDKKCTAAGFLSMKEVSPLL